MSTTKRTRFFLRGISDILNAKLRGKGFEYYHDQYWNDIPAIQNYINKRATNNSEITWIKDIQDRFAENLPFERILIVGCGNGWLERQLYDMGIGKHYDAFDISPEHIDLAKQLSGDRKINYFLDDMDDLKNIPSQPYDAIFNVGVLHHVFRLSRTAWTLHGAHKQNGLMFNCDYVGPSHNQYSDSHVKILEQVNDELGSRFSTIIPLRPKKSNFETGDPTEAVNADLVRPTLSRFFDIVYDRDLNGGVAYQLLWNNIEEFKKDDDDAKDAIELLISRDDQFTQEGKVPVLFWYSVVTPKPKNEISTNELLPP